MVVSKRRDSVSSDFPASGSSTKARIRVWLRGLGRTGTQRTSTALPSSSSTKAAMPTKSYNGSSPKKKLPRE